MKLIDKIKMNASLLWHSLFYAMRAGDKEIFQTSDGKSDSEINHQISIGGVMEELLKQEETEKVKEIRDEYYRILNEADKYHVDLDMKDFLDHGGDIHATARRKTSSDFTKHCVVDESDGLKLRVIQDNKFIPKKTNFEVPTGSESPYDYDTLIDIERNGFRPRFELEKIATKIVVKEYTNTEAVIELYLPTTPRQYDSVSALFQNELKKIYEDKNYKTDSTDFISIGFITDKAWNSDSLCEFKYDNIKYEGITIFDGSYVLRFVGRIVNDGTSLSEKYKTKELDEKYKNKAPKSDTIKVDFTSDFNIEGIDFGKQTINVK